MKNQFKKGFRQIIKGVDYIVKTMKLGAGHKILIKEKILVKPTREEFIKNKGK